MDTDTCMQRASQAKSIQSEPMQAKLNIEEGERYQEWGIVRDKVYDKKSNQNVHLMDDGGLRLF